MQVGTGGDRVSWSAMDDGSGAPAKQSRRSNPVLLEREKVAAIGYVTITSSNVSLANDSARLFQLHVQRKL